MLSRKAELHAPLLHPRVPAAPRWNRAPVLANAPGVRPNSRLPCFGCNQPVSTQAIKPDISYSTAFKFRLSLLFKCGHAFEKIFAPEAFALHLGLSLKRTFQIR